MKEKDLNRNILQAMVLGPIHGIDMVWTKSEMVLQQPYLFWLGMTLVNPALYIYIFFFFLGKEKEVRCTGETSQETKEWREFQARWLIQGQQ